ncbi:MAG TPA: ATP-dependent sacrificial sulfur transferase LarE [Candidatus Acidoferrales bacterium]|nr:ATP-dependent sacrificial sulfur transferase LarE [Candidatus Acidoferrales bacterium]
MSAGSAQTTLNEVTATEQQSALLRVLAELPSLIVALSGGADSAYLAWAADQALGERSLCVTALSASYSAYDREQVEGFIAASGVRHEFIETQELSDDRYTANNTDRCYFCKDELFRALDALAADRKIAAVAYGINTDDTSDFRPGHRAAREHKVLAPLLDAGLRKAEIRELSRRAGLPTWDRPASACLSSRIPYGTEVTPETLGRVERAEASLRALGFRQFRVRHFGETARVEIAVEELPKALEEATSQSIAAGLRNAGYLHVAIDLKGYRQGSLNVALLPGAVELPASDFRILK